MNYTRAIRSAGIAALSSTICVHCYVKGDWTAFFGVEDTGPLCGRPTIMGTRPKDLEFQKAIWNAAKNHLRETHGLQIDRNGMGGWKTERIQEEAPR